jgi:hypothetical protein
MRRVLSVAEPDGEVGFSVSDDLRQRQRVRGTEPFDGVGHLGVFWRA